MRVTIAGVEYRFWFKHHDHGTMALCDGDGIQKMLLERGITDVENWRVSSHLAKGDKFCKATGRRVSLTRLLRSLSHPTNLGWTANERGLVWAEYFKQHRDLKHD